MGEKTRFRVTGSDVGFETAGKTQAAPQFPGVGNQVDGGLMEEQESERKDRPGGGDAKSSQAAHYDSTDVESEDQQGMALSAQK